MAVLRGRVGILFTISLVCALNSFACELEVVELGTQIAGSTPVPLVPESTATVLPQPRTPTPIFSGLAFRGMRESASSISYDDLFRNNERHLGTVVYYVGQVIQVVSGDEDKYALRVNVTRSGNSWDDPVLLLYSGPRLLDGDIIEFAGTVSGLAVYEAIFGNQVTVPQINAIEARLVDNSSEPIPTSVVSNASPVVVGSLTPTATPTLTPLPSSTPEPMHFSGRGQRASAKFNLSRGLAVFKMTHDGLGHFGITLIDSEGGFVDLL